MHVLCWRKIMTCSTELFNVKNNTPLQYAEMFIDRYINKIPAPELSFLCFCPVGKVFNYPQGIVLRGIQEVCERNGKSEYKKYITDWIESVTDKNGIPIHNEHGWSSKDSLDFRQAGNLFFDLYNETKDQKYINCLDFLFKEMKNFNKTPHGCFSHNVAEERKGQIYIDGLFMAGPASVKYAVLSNDAELLDIALKQPIIMWDNIRDHKTGLLRHAYDEYKKADWADKETGLSGFVWGRGIGWYVAAITEMYEAAPKDHKYIARIREIIKELFENIIKYQSPKGRWYQVVDRADDPRNWIDNSGTFLILYAMAKAIKNKVIDESYTKNLLLGYRDAIENSTVITDDDFKILDICAGTTVGENVEFYYYRPRVINEAHGVAGFLLMCAEIDAMLKND